MMGVQRIVEIGAHDGQWTLIVTQGAVVTGDLIARGDNVVAIPVILSECAIDRQRMIPGMRQRGVDK